MKKKLNTSLDLKPRCFKKTIIILLFLFTAVKFFAQQPIGSNLSTNNVNPTQTDPTILTSTSPSNYPPPVTISCTVNNTLITSTGTSAGSYCPPTDTSTCASLAVYSGDNPWTGFSNTGYLNFTFSQPVTSATLLFNAINGINSIDVATITSNSCSPLIFSDLCNVAQNSNVLTCNAHDWIVNVKFTVSSATPFTSINLVNTGGNSGWVVGNLCNFQVTPYTCNLPAPIFIKPSVTTCPSSSFNLVNALPTNNPFSNVSCGYLTWHTGSVATNSNTITNLVVPTNSTYYASYFDPISNCYSPSTAYEVSMGCPVDLQVLKTINNNTPSVGSNVTFTIKAFNLSLNTATNTVVTDVLPSGYTFVSATPSVGTWSASNWNIGTLAGGATAMLTITATVKSTGEYTNAATITSNDPDAAPSNNTSAVTPYVLNAAPDYLSSSIINMCTGGVTTSVLANDTLNSLPVSSATVTTSIVNSGGLVGLSINSTGELSVGAANAIGNYSISYKICQTALGFTSNCAQSSALITVSKTIVAVNDVNINPINTLTGGTTSSVLGNDTLDGTPVSSTSVNTTIVSVTPTIVPTPTMLNNGVIIIPPGTTIGNYNIVYKIAQIGCTANFTTATATISVNEQTISTLPIASGVRADNVVALCDTQSSGKIIIAGQFSNYNNISNNGITRLNTNLTLDTSIPFVSSGPIPFTSPLALKIIKNMGTNFNKIIVVGSFDSFNQGTNGRGIARLNVDGAIDNTFNAGQLSTPTSIRGVSGGNATIQSCYVIPDGFANAGKILIGGIFTNYNGYPANNIALLNANGTYDTTSGFNVKVNTILDNTNPQAMPGFNSAPTVFEVQSNGQIVVAGYFTMYNGLNRVGLVRLNADGTFDTTFNSAYTGANPLFSTVGLPNSGNTIKTMVLQPDGKIIIGGYFSFYNNVSRNNIVRINSDGSLDTTFNVGTGFNNTVIHPVTGTNGLVRKLVLDTTSDLAKWFVYVSGDFTTYQNSTCDEIIRIICKSSNTATIGNKDNNFIMAGNGTNGTVWSMKPQNDGKIIIGGQFTTYGGLPSLNVTRILPSNTLITFEAKNSVVYYDSEPEIDQFNQSELILYPNPSKGMFNFNANYFEGEDVCVQVYNQLGQKVFERIYVHTNDASFDLSEMAKGIFFVTFTSKSKSQTRVIELN